MSDESNPRRRYEHEQKTPPSGVRRVRADQTGQTQKVNPQRGTRPMQPVRQAPPNRQTGQIPVPSQQAASPRPGTARYRRENAVYLPLWLIALMLVLVALTAGAIVLLVISLGGNNDTPDEAPVVVMSSAVPTTRPDSFPLVPITPTLPAFADRSVQQPVGTFALAGPTLATPVISPTPRPVDIGADVVVVDVGDQQLNIRDQAGVFETSVIFRVPEGGRMTVLEGPLQIDGLTWWRVQNAANPSQTGWAAANYLQVPPEEG